MEQSKKTHSKALVIGLALFSMFFGSGNLIFPLAVGRFSGEHYLAGALGFILTAVLVPFAGVVAMVVYDGDYRKFFSFMGQRTGFLITLILLSFWIPFGSGPRCVTLSFASVSPFFPSVPLWGFGLVYTAIVFALSYKKSRIIDILGYVLTPSLLICLGILVYQGARLSTGLPATGVESHSSFLNGLLEGYNTMDLIASFFFSSTIIGILKDREKVATGSVSSKKGYISLAFRSGMIGVGILGGVYLGLMFVAAAHSPVIQGVAKESLLPHLALNLMGSELGGLASVAIALACLTTSIALSSVFSDFLREKCFQNRITHRQSLTLTCLISYGMSTLGFQTIAALSEPVFQVFYPTLIVLILILVPAKVLKSRKKAAKIQPEGCVS